jgi:sulfofructose kinase
VSATRKHIICVGHAALDRVFTVDAWPADSGKIAAHAFEESGGGMAANAAAAIVRLGGEAEFWGPTGHDAVAEAIRGQLAADGVNIENFRSFPGRSSSHSAVIVDARGERLVVGYRGTALQERAEWLPLEQAGFAGALLADVRWPEGAAAALRAARDAGIPAILDGEVCDGDLLHRLVGLADRVVFSERGLAAWSDEGLEDGLHKALQKGARVAAVTRGAAGVSWIDSETSGKLRHLPAHAVDVVDTLAAGDVFHGAYALALAEGRSPEEAMQFANAAAAIKCTRPGGRKGAPGREEVEAFLRTVASG